MKKMGTLIAVRPPGRRIQIGKLLPDVMAAVQFDPAFLREINSPREGGFRV
jgi:hypothetical protein